MFLIIHDRNSIFIQYVAPQGIIDIVNKFKPKSSSGQDEISPKLMKATIAHIFNPITHISNQSLQTGIVPEKNENRQSHANI
jgi:hypothetical protein